MPYITEEIWDSIPNSGGAIIVSDWPVAYDSSNDDASEADMELIMNSIRSIRNVRAEMDVVPSKKAKVLIVTDDKTSGILKSNEDYLIALASASEVLVETKGNIPEDAVSVVVEGGELFLPLEELIDFSKELDRLEKEKAKLESEVNRVVKKLANEGFVAKAPEKLLDEEKAKKEKYEGMLKTVAERIESMSKKLSK